MLIRNGQQTIYAGSTVSQSITASSIFVNGAISASSITASNILGTASWATNASTASIVTGTITSASFATTASYITASGISGTINSASYALTSSFATTAGTANSLNINNSYQIASLTASNMSASGILTASALYSSTDVNAAANLRSLFSSGDEGGEIFLNKPVTNTSITGGVTIDVYQNKIRLFEQGGTNRGGFWDINSLSAGVGTNLLSGSGGGTTPGGSNGQIQYNNSSTFGGVPTLTYDGSTLRATGSFSGSLIGSLTGTSSWANNAITASYVSSSTISGTVTSASYALTSSYSEIANTLYTNKGYQVTSLTSSTISASGTITANNLNITLSISGASLTGSHLGTSSWASNALTASYITASNIAGVVTSASYALTSSFSTTSSFASNVGTVNSLNSANSYQIQALTASAISSSGTITGNNLNIIASISGASITGSFTGSLTGALTGTASWATNSRTASYVTASNVFGIVSSASYALNSGNSITSSYLNGSGLLSSGNILRLQEGVNFRFYDLSIYDDDGFIQFQNSASIRRMSLSQEGILTLGSVIPNPSSHPDPSNPFILDVYGPSRLNGSLYVSANITASRISASNGITGSLFGTASVSNNSISSSYISGANGIINNLTVTGVLNATQISGSQIYVTSSTLIVTDNLITLNAASPYLRYAGLEMYDTGSGTLANFLWDGQNNYFFLSSSAAGYSRKIITGPDGETDLTTNYIPLITSSNGLINSIIYQSGNNIGIGNIVPVNRLDVTGNISASNITASLFFGTASLANTASFVQSSSFSLTSSLATTAGTSNALNINNSYQIQSLTASTISSSGTITGNNLNVILSISGGSLTGSHLGNTTGTSSWSNNSLTASYITASNIFGTITSASYSLTSSFSTTSSFASTVGTANALNINNSYQIQALTASAISASGTINANNLTATLSVSGASLTGSHLGTSSWASNALTASYITASNIAGTIASASYSLSSSFSLTSSFATTAGTATTLNINNSYQIQSLTASAVSSSGNIIGNNLTVVLSISGASLTGSHLGTSSWATNALTASSVTGTITSASFATSASYALTSSFATTAGTANGLNINNSYKLNVLTASVISSSANITSSNLYANNIIAITSISGASITGSMTGSHVGSLQGTASWATNSITASFLLGSVTSASYAATSSIATSSSYSLSASFATTAAALVTANSYNITNLTAAFVTASSLSASNLSVANTASISMLAVGRNIGPDYLLKVRQINADDRVAGNNLLARFTDYYNSNEGSTYIGLVCNAGASPLYSFIKGGFDFSIGSYNESALIYLKGTGVLAGDERVSIKTTSSAATLTVNGGVSASLGFSGSLRGTASWASNSLNSISASYAATSSFFVGTVTSASYAATSSIANTALGLLAGNSYQLTNLTASNISASGTITANNLNVITSISGARVSGSFTGSLTGSLFGTSSWAVSASWAPGGSSTSASYAATASYIQQTTPYLTITTASNQYITASFSVLDQYVNITFGQAYSFTCSNMPSSGQTANTTLFINNTATATSSLSFPASWKFLGSAPSSISSSRVGVLSLKAYDASTVIASFAVQY